MHGFFRPINANMLILFCARRNLAKEHVYEKNVHRVTFYDLKLLGLTFLAGSCPASSPLHVILLFSHAVGGMDFKDGETLGGVGGRAGMRTLLLVLLGSVLGHQWQPLFAVHNKILPVWRQVLQDDLVQRTQQAVSIFQGGCIDFWWTYISKTWKCLSLNDSFGPQSQPACPSPLSGKGLPALAKNLICMHLWNLEHSRNMFAWQWCRAAFKVPAAQEKLES